MSDMHLDRVSPVRSIFAIGVGNVAVAVAVVCSILYVLGSASERDLAFDGLRNEAHDTTVLTATTLGGAVRFGNTEAIATSLAATAQLAGSRLSSGAVIDAEGRVVGEVGAVSQGLELAEAALRNDADVLAADGLTVAIPVRIDGSAAPVGALVLAWDATELIATIDASNRERVTLAGGVFLLTLVASGLIFRMAISRPLEQLSRRAVLLAEGDLEGSVPCRARADELGATARNLERLRAALAVAAEQQREAVFKGKAFETASAPLLLTDTALVVTQFNDAFRAFVSDIHDGLTAEGLDIDVEALIGRSVDVSFQLPQIAHAELEAGDTLPNPTVKMGNHIISLDISRVLDLDGAHIGYLIEWRDNTEALSEKAIISAIDAGQMRAEFAEDGTLRVVNPKMIEHFPGIDEMIGTLTIEAFITGGRIAETLTRVRAGTSTFGQFDCSAIGDPRIVRGNISPLRDLNGAPNGFILIGKDVTEDVAADAKANHVAEVAQVAQEHVVDALTEGLNRLSQGDLSSRIDAPFAPEYERLRHQFNDSMQSLDNAISLVIENSTSILDEASNISSAAGDLSKRTEQQAATLEGFVAALTEVTASVTSTARGATQANDVVDQARTNAEASGTVVKEAVEAMGEISTSSKQIGQIIGVIDDIAFQTNLLALNAGVEAARAGDAGRGFAVVASEVRALAQRSSDAAREINTLISTSGAQVKKGVSLVDKAGLALTEIVGSVGGIAEHVATIAASAKEQSSGLDEISTSISQLDQVTQQNVAMFEETTAATHTLSNEANDLVEATQRFRTTTGRGGGGAARASQPKVFEPDASAEKLAFEEDAEDDARAMSAKPAAALQTDGSAALAFEDGDWDDF